MAYSSKRKPNQLTNPMKNYRSVSMAVPRLFKSKNKEKKDKVEGNTPSQAPKWLSQFVDSFWHWDTPRTSKRNSNSDMALRKKGSLSRFDPALEAKSASQISMDEISARDCGEPESSAGSSAGMVMDYMSNTFEIQTSPEEEWDGNCSFIPFSVDHLWVDDEVSSDGFQDKEEESIHSSELIRDSVDAEHQEAKPLTVWRGYERKESEPIWKRRAQRIPLRPIQVEATRAVKF